MIEEEKLDDFVAGLLPEEEAEALRKAIEQSPEAQDALAERALIYETQRELERRSWVAELEKLEADKAAAPSPKVIPLRRRLYVLSAVAASLLALVTATWFFFLRPPDEIIRGNDLIDLSQLAGNWNTTVNPSPNTDLELRVDVQSNQTFSLSGTFFTNNSSGEGDKITASGTYEVKGDQLTFLLNENTIKKVPGANPFNTATAEQWLKTSNLFGKNLQLIRLSSSELVVQYGNTEGWTWTKD